jgi:excisionase family DNA binding protein
VAEVAEMLAVSERQVYQMAQDGQIPSFKLGGSVRFDPHLLANWLRRIVDGGFADPPTWHGEQPFKPAVVRRALDGPVKGGD